MSNEVVFGDKPDVSEISGPSHGTNVPQTYRLYRRRFVGLFALMLLTIGGGLPGSWFGPISNDVAAEFNFTLDQVNWLSNVINLAYLPCALLAPVIATRFGIRNCCLLGGAALVLSAWIRFAGTAKSLSPDGAYALLMLGSIISSLAQSVSQVMGPAYSETWFDLKGRTTATMAVGIANPVGNAIGQLLSPAADDTRRSVLILAIISSVIAPFVLLIGDAPPTPPTFSASTHQKHQQTLTSLFRAMLGLSVEESAFMSKRERVDFVIVASIFAVLVAATNAFSILSAQVLQPYGYSSDVAGFMGATLLLAGLIAALITAPLLDRVFTHPSALARLTKVLAPLTGVGWFVLVWAIRPNNTGALFAIFAVIGICAIAMLPVGLELSCELTRNAESSSAVIWFMANLLVVVFVLSLSALRRGEDASPPLNMKRSVIFLGIFCLAVTLTSWLIRGEAKRKALDQEKQNESMAVEMPVVSSA
ncbi:MFS general substrate transporter [Crepidotus variabilis]|uniref:MFS general substrate transporter n=1 Tax=Crepidotus variabilis TaxID=179855 RepID=A0A9P6JNE1_9AGAR|nr:MFS general substrate transporter [Crepidotus variabilis]